MKLQLDVSRKFDLSNWTLVLTMFLCAIQSVSVAQGPQNGDGKNELTIEQLQKKGKFVSALKQTRQSIEHGDGRISMFEAAVLAGNIGDQQAALVRYETFLTNNPVNEEKTLSKQQKQAIEYLLANGTYPAYFYDYVASEGATDQAWIFGKRQVVRLYRNLEPDSAVELSVEMLDKFCEQEKTSGRVAFILNRAHSALSSGTFGQDTWEKGLPILEKMIEKTVFPDGEKYLYALVRKIPAKIDVRLNVLLSYQEVIGKPLDYGRNRTSKLLKNLMLDLRSSTDDKMKRKFAKRFLEIESIYKESDDPTDYTYFTSIIAASPQVFHTDNNPVITTEEAKKIATQLLEKYLQDGRDFDAGNVLDQLAKYYFGEAGNKTLVQIFTNQLKKLDRETVAFAVDRVAEPKEKVALLDRWIKETEPALYDKMALEYQFLSLFDELAMKQRLVKVVRKRLVAFPANFGAGKLGRHFLNNDDLTPEERVKPFLDLAQRGGGDNGELRQLIRENMYSMYAENKAWRSMPDFAQLMKVVKERTYGTDLVSRSFVQLHQIREDSRRPDDKVYTIAEKFVESYQGTVPAGFRNAETSEQIAVIGILDKHAKHVWRHRGAYEDLLKLWLPKLEPGGTWKWLIDRAFDIRVSDAVMNRAVVPEFLQRANDNKPFAEDLWPLLAKVQVDNRTGYTPFQKYYKEMGAQNAFRHAVRQRQWNSQAWWDQIKKISSLEGFDFGPLVRKKSYRDLIRRYCRHNYQVPVKILDKIWQDYLAWEKENQVDSTAMKAEIISMYARARFHKSVKKRVGEVLELAKEKEPEDRLKTAVVLNKYKLINFDDAENLKIHVKPFFEEKKLSERVAHEINRKVLRGLQKQFGVIERSGKTDGEMRSLIDQVLKTLTAIGYTTSYSPEALNLISEECKRQLDKENWNEVARLAVFLGENLDWALNRNTENAWKGAIERFVKPLATKLDQAGGHEISYLMLENLQKNVGQRSLHKQVAMMKAAVSKHISDMLPVSRDHPAYELFLAAHDYNLGSAGKAWQLTLARLDLLKKYWQDLDPEYVAWAVEQMRIQNMLNKAKDHVFYFLLKEEQLTPQAAGRFALIKADVLRDMNELEAARLEYQSIIRSKRYEGTKPVKDAYLHLIDLLITMKNFSDAEQRLEWLKQSNDLAFRADGFYLHAKMAYTQRDYPKANEYLEKVFEIDDDHTKARLLEGQLRLHLKGGLENTEIAIGDELLQTIVIPGRLLPLKLNDSNLAIARGGKAIPVVLTTDPGGDREMVMIRPSVADNKKFRGEIQAQLGTIKKNNDILEVRGNDRVYYQIEEEFQKNNNIEYPAKQLTVAAAGQLQVSATEILTPEEMQKQKMLDKQEAARQVEQGRKAKSARFQKRSGDSVRPGSSLFAQVIDLDRDVSEKRDTVTVDLHTSSGDILKGVHLKEEKKHNAIFQGAIPTGVPSPRASASDNREGSDVSVLINSTKDGIWQSLGGEKEEKWLEVDTMSSHELQSASLFMPDSDRVKSVTLLGRLDEDYIRLGQFPPDRERKLGGLTTIHVKDNGRPSTLDGIKKSIDKALEERNIQGTKQFDNTRFVRKNTKFGDRRNWVATRVKGAFYVPENQLLELTFLQEPVDHLYGYVVIDDEMVIGGNLTKRRLVNQNGHIFLPRGVHKFETYILHHRTKSELQVGYRKADGSVEPLPAEWFSAEANPELMKFLQLRADIERMDSGFKANFRRPTRIRQVRWVIEDYTSEYLKAKKMTLVNTKGETVIPVKRDFSMDVQNNTLEVAPEDVISVVYKDKKRLDRSKPELVAELTATYYDGEIELVHEEVQKKGNSFSSEFHEAKRTKIGQQLMLRVQEYDADTTKKKDKLPVTLTSTNGNELVVQAVETEPHSGIFQQIIKFDTKPGENTLIVDPGDQITATYVDKQNTDPGIPVERSYVVFEAGVSIPVTTVLRGATDIIVDESKSAENLAESFARGTGAEAENIEVYSKVGSYSYPEALIEEEAEKQGVEPDLFDMEIEEKTTLEMPILFEVNHPSMALHAGSEFVAYAYTKAEKQRAQKEGREPRMQEILMKIENVKSMMNEDFPTTLNASGNKQAESMLMEGSFIGIVDLKLGEEPNSQVPQKEYEGALSDFGNNNEQRKGERPTLYVNGKDTVIIRVEDQHTNDVEEIEVELASDAKIHLLDQTYTYGQSEIHLGEKFFIEIEDRDRDRKVMVEPDSENPGAKPVWRERPNKITVQVQSVDPESGEVHHTVDLELPETGRNTGVFSRSIQPAYQSFNGNDASGAGDDEKKGESVEGQPKPEATVASKPDRNDTILVDFGDRVIVSYKDTQNVSYDEDRVISVEGKIFKGADTDLTCYTKKFEDLEMAVKTQFLTAEALFEMAKKLRKIDKKNEASQRMKQGKRVLEEALRDYPQSEYIQQGLFLLATLEQQMGEVNYKKMEKLKKDNESVFKSDQDHPLKEQYEKLKRERDRHYEEATKRFTGILSKYPDSEYAPRSQFKNAVCLERKGDYDAACEEYVKVTYLYPNHELVPKATARLGNHFFGIKKYDVAAEVFFKFQQRYPQHEVAPKALLLSGQAYMKMKKFEKASRVLTILKNNYEDALQQRAEGLYWLGRSYEAVKNYESAYKAFKVLTWDHPATNWAKHARAKLISKKYKKLDE